MAFNRLMSEENHQSFEDAPAEIWDRIHETFGPVAPSQVVILLQGVDGFETVAGEIQECGSIVYIGATQEEIAQDLIDLTK